MDEYSNIETSVIPYDQTEIERVMKQILFSNGVTDVVYEGSNISQLTSIISYVIATLNANTAINIQETLLPLATKRMNILFGARQLGYEPHAVKSYKYELTLVPLYDQTKLTPDGELDTKNREDRYITLVQNTEFKCGDKTYYYVGPTLNDIIKVSNYDIQFLNADPTEFDNPADIPKPREDITLKIPVVEGVMTTYLDDEMLQYTAIDYIENGVTLTKQDYLVPYKNLEEDYGIQVFLTYNDDGYQVIDEQWHKSEQFLIDETLDYNKRKFVRKQNIILDYPAIFFQFAGFGNGIRSGTIIRLNVLQSSGEDGEAIGPFEVADTAFSTEMRIDTRNYIEGSAYDLIERGRTYETDDEIKDNAVVFKNTGNRAVTKYDYIAITKRHPFVKEADAWGGEEENPERIGNIFISCTPFEQSRPIVKSDYAFAIDVGNTAKTSQGNEVQRNWRNWYLTEDEQEKLFMYLEPYKILTMKLNYRHPLYINFDYEIDVVKYNMSQPAGTTNSIIFYTMNEFFMNQVEKFDSEYLNSNLQRVLDTVLEYKTGVNVSLKLSGTLCKEMIEDVNGRQLIITNLSWPYEVIVEDNELHYERLPKIDGEFGFYNGQIKVDMSSLADESQTSHIRKADIMYYNESFPVPPEDVETGDYKSSSKITIPTDEKEIPDSSWVKIGEYIINMYLGTIDVIFDLSPSQYYGEAHFFGPEDENGDRSYTEFQINYYPFDNNMVNLPFGKNRMPRLRNVVFTKI